MAPELPHLSQAPHTKRSLNIIDLPEEVLREIFSHLGDPRVLRHGIYDWHKQGAIGICDWHEPTVSSAAVAEYSPRTIASARLTCRRLCEIATPHLLPVVNLTIDQASLDRAEAISRSPIIASGVRAVSVDLHYRPREPDENVTLFYAWQKVELDRMGRACTGVQWDDPERKAHAERVLVIRSEMNTAWEQLRGRREASEDDGPAEYRLAILQAYEDYQRKHAEQSDLLSSGSFARSIAASISRMPYFGTLGFHSKDAKELPWMNDPWWVFNSTQSLSEFLTRPYDWEALEYLYNKPGGTRAVIEPVWLLSDLPMAIHSAGGTLRRLHVTLPCFADHIALLKPRNQDPAVAGWDKLQAACRSVEDVYFYGHQGLGDYDPLANGNHDVNKYMGAILSSPSLERATLWSMDYIRDRSTDVELTMRYPAGPLLSSITSTRFTDFKAASISVENGDLEDFTARLGPQLTSLELHHSSMRPGGSLNAAVEALQIRLRGRGCRVRLRVLTQEGTDGYLVSLDF